MANYNGTCFLRCVCGCECEWEIAQELLMANYYGTCFFEVSEGAFKLKKNYLDLQSL